MTVQVDVQYAATGDGLPSAQDVETWVAAALMRGPERAELTVRIVDEAEITQLNRTYRGRSGPTNVLSFPYDALPGVVLPLLGDVVVCAPVVAREARQQGKPPQAHWAHMVVHGTLHLLGYDHGDEAEARKMEGLEKEILARLGYGDPYGRADAT